MPDNRDKIQAAKETLMAARERLEKMISDMEDSIVQIGGNIEALDDLPDDADEMYIDELKRW